MTADYHGCAAEAPGRRAMKAREDGVRGQPVGRQHPSTHAARAGGTEHVFALGASHFAVRYFASAFLVTESDLHEPTTIAQSASVEHARSVCETPAQSASSLRHAALSPTQGAGAATDSPGPMPQRGDLPAGAVVVGAGAIALGGGAGAAVDVGGASTADDAAGAPPFSGTDSVGTLPAGEGAAAQPTARESARVVSARMVDDEDATDRRARSAVRPHAKENAP